MLRCVLRIERKDDVAFIGGDARDGRRGLGGKLGELVAGGFFIGRHTLVYGAGDGRARPFGRKVLWGTRTTVSDPRYEAGLGKRKR